jgi:hypothetical protein
MCYASWEMKKKKKIDVNILNRIRGKINSQEKHWKCENLPYRLHMSVWTYISLPKPCTGFQRHLIEGVDANYHTLFPTRISSQTLSNVSKATQCIKRGHTWNTHVITDL